MNFYFDENIPKVIARALNELEKERLEVTVQHTEVVWGKGIKDPQLIEKLHEVDGILLTNDLKMKRNFYQLLKLNKISAFFIVFPSGASFELRYQQVFKVWESIKELARKEKRPFLFKIQNNGRAVNVS